MREVNLFERIRKLLNSLTNYDTVAHVVKRVLQRVPTLSSRMIDESSEYPKNRQKLSLISLFVDKIKNLIDEQREARNFGLPVKVVEYLQYIDLLVTVQRSTHKVWQVYHMRGFSRNSSGDTPEDEIYRLRSKIKSWFSSRDLLSSIQAEFYQNKFWFSIAYVSKTKDRTKDKARLQKSKRSFLVHFPGESYFYAAGSKLPPHLGEAVSESLYSTGYTIVPLTGRHLDSLRQLRLNREGRQDAGALAPTRDRFSVFEHATQPEQEYPTIETLRTECNFEFQGIEALENPENIEGKKMRIRLECRGSDIIGGLNALVSEDVINSDHVPRWVRNLPNAGRNQFTLVNGGSSQRENDWELQSVMSSATTVMDVTRAQLRRDS